MLDALIDLTGTTTTPEFKIAAPLLNHIETLHGACRGWTEVSVIHPTPSEGQPRTVTLWAYCEDKEQQAKNALRAARANIQGYGVYVGICPRKEAKTAYHRGKIKDAIGITALWCDLDSNDITTLKAFEPQASIILATGGGFHGYWMLERPELPSDAHRLAMRGIAKAIGADTSVCEFARVLRALGSYNTKPGRNNARCIILRWEPDRRYELRDFAHLIEAEPPKPVRSADPVEYDAEIPAWIQEYLDRPPAKGQRNSTLFRVAGGLHDRNWTEQDALGLLRGFGGLDDKEVEQAVHSAFVRPARGAVVRGRTDTRAAARG